MTQDIHERTSAHSQAREPGVSRILYTRDRDKQCAWIACLRRTHTGTTKRFVDPPSERLGQALATLHPREEHGPCGSVVGNVPIVFVCTVHMTCSPTPSFRCSYSQRKPTFMPTSSPWYLITSDARSGLPVALLADYEQAERLLCEHYPR